MSASLVMATAMAVTLTQAIIQATEAPLAAMTLMQTALVSQQAVAAGIREELAACPAGGNGSDTGEMSCASGPSTSPSGNGTPDPRLVPELDIVTAAPPAASSHTGA
jgi:hypothetical protein